MVAKVAWKWGRRLLFILIPESIYFLKKIPHLDTTHTRTHKNKATSCAIIYNHN